MPKLSITFSAPIWANPFAPPPLKTNPTLGSFFMVIALYFRQYLLFRNKSNLHKIFVIDVVNSLIYLFIILSVCFINLQVLFSFIFLIFSIFNFFIFSIYSYFEKYNGIRN